MRCAVVGLALLALWRDPVMAEAPGTLSVEEIRTLFNDEMMDMAYSIHMAKNQFDEALQVAEKAITSRSDSLEWHRKAAYSAERAGKRELALTHWLYLIEQGDGVARQSALRLTRSMNEFTVRKNLLEGMLLSGNADQDILKEYILVSESLGASGEAYDLLSSKISFGDRESLLKELVRLAEELGRPADAVNALDMLAQIRPLTSEEQVKRTALQFGTGDLQRGWQKAFGSESGEVMPPQQNAGGTALTEARRTYSWSEVRRKKETQRYLVVDPPSVGAAVKYELNQDERRVSGRTTTDNSHTVTERLDMSTRGYLYHPALLQFRLQFAPEFTQNVQSHSDSTGDVSTNGSNFSPNYLVNATLLNQKPYTLNLFSQHLEAQSWASYSGITKTVTDSYGAEFALKYSLFPTAIGFSKSIAEQRGYYRTNSNWEELHLFSRHSDKLTGESSLSSSYSSNKQQTDSVASTIKTFNNNFNNQLKLRGDDKLRLDSNLQYIYQDATTTRTNSFLVSEQLAWQHLSNLKSLYQYNYRQITTTTSSNYWHSLDARLTHTLYENLTTIAGVTGILNDIDGGSQDSLAAVVSTDYRRKLGSWGMLGLSAGINELYTSRTGNRGVVQVTNEPHTLSSGSETFLNQADSLLASVVVTNSSGTVIYVNGIDYRLDTVGRSVRISRLPMGAIGDGQLVLVSYNYTRNAGFDDQVLTQNYGVNLELFRALFLSYRYLQADQTVLSGPSPDRLSNSAIHLVNARYDEGWGETGITYEDAINNSDLSYTRWEASQWLRLRYSNWLQANLRGYYGETNYRGIADRKKHYGGTSSASWSPYAWLKMTLEGYLERIEGSLESALNGGCKGDVEARYRLWSARIGYRYAEQNDLINSYNRRNHILQFEIVRTVW